MAIWRTFSDPTLSCTYRLKFPLLDLVIFFNRHTLIRPFKINVARFFSPTIPCTPRGRKRSFGLHKFRTAVQGSLGNICTFFAFVICSLSLVRHFGLHASLAYELVVKLSSGSPICLLGGHDALRGWWLMSKNQNSITRFMSTPVERLSGRSLTSAL